MRFKVSALGWKFQVEIIFYLITKVRNYFLKSLSLRDKNFEERTLCTWEKNVKNIKVMLKAQKWKYSSHIDLHVFMFKTYILFYILYDLKVSY
jgi:hypothetical protein